MENVKKNYGDNKVKSASADDLKKIIKGMIRKALEDDGNQFFALFTINTFVPK